MAVYANDGMRGVCMQRNSNFGFCLQILKELNYSFLNEKTIFF